MPVLLGQGSVWRRAQTVTWGDRGRISLQIHRNTPTCKKSSLPVRYISSHSFNQPKDILNFVLVIPADISVQNVISFPDMYLMAEEWSLGEYWVDRYNKYSPSHHSYIELITATTDSMWQWVSKIPQITFFLNCSTFNLCGWCQIHIISLTFQTYDMIRRVVQKDFIS